MHIIFLPFDILKGVTGRPVGIQLFQVKKINPQIIFVWKLDAGRYYEQ